MEYDSEELFKRRIQEHGKLTSNVYCSDECIGRTNQCLKCDKETQVWNGIVVGIAKDVIVKTRAMDHNTFDRAGGQV